MASGSSKSEADQDQLLVSRAIKGDADAFGLLYTQHLDAIYRYVYFRVGETALAEDLTEEVFVRAWTALPKYRSRGHPFSSWLYRIAHNMIVDHYRKRSARDTAQAQFPNDTGEADATPEKYIVDLEEIEELARSIQGLSDEEKDVIILRFVEGLSHREVAEVIGKSEGASRVIQHRALETLAARMKVDEQQ